MSIASEKYAKEATDEILGKANRCEIKDGDDEYPGFYFKDDDATPDDELIEDMHEERVFIPAILSAIEAATKEKDEIFKLLEGEYKDVCGRLRVYIEKYGLGLGGEHISELIVADAEKQRQTIARLLAVIEPFAAEYYESTEDSRIPGGDKQIYHVFVGDLRRAAEIYDEYSDDPPGLRRRE
jgi:hypothetical protein